MESKSKVVVWGGGLLALVALFLVGVGAWESYQAAGWIGPTMLLGAVLFWLGRTVEGIQRQQLQLRDPMAWLDSAMDVLPRALLDTACLAVVLLLARWAF